MRNSSTKHEELRKLGYADVQIPAWVARSVAESKPQSVVEAVGIAQGSTPKPPESPAIVEEARKNASTDSPDSPTTSTNSPDSPTTSTTPQGLQGEDKFLQEANQALQKSGQHAEPLGSDALQRWVVEGGIQVMNGGYWQRRQLPSG